MPHKPAVDGLIERIASQSDLPAILKTERLTANQLLYRLRTSRGQKQLARWKSLARIHGILLIYKHTPRALSHLHKMMEGDDQSAAVKATLAFLNLAGLKAPPKPPRARRPKKSPQSRQSLKPENLREFQKALNIGLEVVRGHRTLAPLETDPTRVTVSIDKRLADRRNAKRALPAGNVTKAMRQC